ncbi:M56 family metallopeptidase [Anaerolentibacter hominis]|uniref:M56 family metallopeptidase n=1 Tax=Anaerolentibacter hominis TaxID=3079009 RepID=UPI0031B89D2E
MNDLMKIVLSMSLSGSLLILVLLLGRPMIRHKLSKQWQYYIWLLVIARLLLPFSPHPGLMGNLFQVRDIPAAGAGLQFEKEASAPLESETLPSGQTTGNPVVPEQPDSASGWKELLYPMTEYIWIVWLAGALLLFIQRLIPYLRFGKRLRSGWNEVSDDSSRKQFQELTHGASIGLYTSPLAASPLIVGLMRPSIVLPGEPLTGTEFQYTILHELTHYKRLDMIYKWLVQITVCLHWFNPLVHLMSREVNRDCELSCDEAVIRKLSPQEQHTYGDTLIHAAGRAAGDKDALACISLSKGAEQLKERLESIMKYKKSSKFAVVMAVILTLTLGAGSVAAGAYTVPDTEAYTAASDYSMSKSGKTYTYTYSQSAYYQKPYIFEIGRGARGNEFGPDYTEKTLILSDRSELTFFLHPTLKHALDDSEAVTALTKLSDTLKERYADTSLPFDHPYLVNMEYVGDKSPKTLAKTYYKKGQLSYFTAVFPLLNSKTQKQYGNKMFKDDKIAFFAASLDDMDSTLINYFTKKAYKEKSISFFSVTVPYMTKKTRQYWINKSKKEKRTSFYAVLMEED